MSDTPKPADDQSDSVVQRIVGASDLKDDLELESKPIKVTRDDEKSEATGDAGLAGSGFSLRTVIQAAVGLAGLVYALIGPAFLLAPEFFFRWFGLGEMNRYAYAQLLGLAATLFALIFGWVALKPKARRHLIWLPYAAMVGTVLILGGHWFYGTESVPMMWKIFCIGQAILAILLLVVIIRLYLPGTVEVEAS